MAKFEIQTPDGILELSAYNAYAISPDKPYIVDLALDEEVIDRYLFRYHDEAFNELERLIGIEIANAIQDRRK